MEEVGSNGVVWSGWRDARNTLRRWREENSRKSDLVVELGLPLLKNHSSALGDEGEMRSDNRVLWLPAHLHPLLCSVVWDVHEQVCTAALDCGDQDTAEVCEFLSSSHFSHAEGKIVWWTDYSVFVPYSCKNCDINM